MKYEEYLLSGPWKVLRLRRIAASLWICEGCGVKSNYLHVHHIHYRNLTDCTLNDLVTLCENCHDLLHRLLKWKYRQRKPTNRAETINVLKYGRLKPNQALRSKVKKLAKKKEAAVPDFTRQRRSNYEIDRIKRSILEGVSYR